MGRSGLLRLALFAALLALLRPVAVAAQPACPVAAGAYDPKKDYFPDKVKPRIAQYMSITYHNSYKLLRNTLKNETYVLYLCNTPKPAASEIEVPKNGTVKFVQVPVGGVGCSSRSSIAYLERLNVRPSIRYVSSTSIITSACLLMMADQGTLQSYPTSGGVTGIDVNFARGPGPSQTNASVEDVTVTLSAVWEDTPLQKFEWLLFISAFYNLESTAIPIFDNISDTYSCNAANVLKLASKKPVVAWLTALDDGTFVTVDWTYRTQLLLDAGVTALISPSVAPLSDVQTSIMDADVLIDDTAAIQSYSDFLTVYGLKDANATNKFKFLKNKQVYKTDKRRNTYGIDDFAQSSWALPDVVQNDLINVMWPDYIKNWSPIFLRNLPNADSYDTVLADQCPKNDSATPLDIPKVVCTAATTSAETQGKAPAPVPVGAIAGGVVGGVLAVAGVALTAFWIKRRKAAEAAAKAEEDMVGFVRMEDGDAPLPAGAEKVLERRGVVN